MPDSTFTLHGTEYSFAAERDLGIRELRQIKQWYPALGSYKALTTASTIGDPDALSCLIWIAQKRAGTPRLQEPMRSADFAVGELMGSFRIEGVSAHKSFPVLTLQIDDKTYQFDSDTVSRNTLRQIKQWYPAIGAFIPLVIALVEGDPDAVASVAWIVRNQAGEVDVPRPPDMDFSVGEVVNSYDVAEVPNLEDDYTPLPLTKDGERPVDPPMPLGGETS